MDNSFFRLVLSAMLMMSFSLFTTSCKQEGCTDPDAYTFDPDAVKSDASACAYPTLVLEIASIVGDQPLVYDQVYQVNGMATSFSTAQFYLSQVQIGDHGDMESLDTYLLISPEKDHYEVGEIKAGHKHSLHFGVGVDSASNFLDPSTYEANHPLAPKSPSMHWSWNSGYIFIRLEGKVDTDGDDVLETDFEFHIGTKNLYRTFEYDVHFDADEADSHLEMTVDFAKFFTGIDLKTDRVTHTMDNMPLAMTVVNNLSTVFSVD